jgi:hypothetical protein
LSPQVFIIVCVDQLGIDTNPVAGTLHAAFQDDVGAKLGIDLADVQKPKWLTD